MAGATPPTTLRPTVKAGKNVSARFLIGLGFLFVGLAGFFGYQFLVGFFWPQAVAEKKEDQKTVIRSGADDLLGTLPKDYSWRKQQEPPASLLVPAVVTEQPAPARQAAPQPTQAPAPAPMPLFFPAGTVHQAAERAHGARQQQATMNQSGQGYAPQPTPAA